MNKEEWETLDHFEKAKAWEKMNASQRETFRDHSNFTPQLLGFDGYRVEVITEYDEKRRFIVGRSTGWQPCHIELYNRRSLGGPSADRKYKSVKVLYYSR